MRHGHGAPKARQNASRASSAEGAAECVTGIERRRRGRMRHLHRAPKARQNASRASSAEGAAECVTGIERRRRGEKVARGKREARSPWDH